MPAISAQPSNRALALFDPLLARAAPVVEADHILGRPRHVGDDEADASAGERSGETIILVGVAVPIRYADFNFGA